ncbi:MAG: hypothetical protein ABR576_00855 [Thermoanaerobaculia bacterium]
MKRLITLLGISALAAATALAQSTTTTNQTTTTVQSDGTVKTVQYTGEVVRYEPGKTIVLRQGTSPAVTYTLGPSLTVPAEVQVGRRVTVYTEPDPSGTTVVTRVITTTSPAPASGAPQASVTTTRETTTQSPQAGSTTTTTTRTTTVTGEVVRIEPGRSILLRQPDSKVITYTLAPSLSIPAEVQAGRKVTIYTEPNDAGSVLVTRVTTVAPEGTAVTRETVSTSEGSQTVTTRSTTVAGEVVRYEPGQTIVIRQPDTQLVTYTLSPSLQAPEEVAIGRRVVITTQPSSSGPVLVTHITTESQAGATTTETVTEKTMESGTGEAQTTIYGTISAYAPGKTITIVQPNKTTLTYVVDAQSELPADLAVGKSVTIRTTTVTGTERPVVRKVTYRTTTQTTKQKTIS